MQFSILLSHIPLAPASSLTFCISAVLETDVLTLGAHDVNNWLFAPESVKGNKQSKRSLEVETAGEEALPSTT
jgi:hypothetical protein